MPHYMEFPVYFDPAVLRHPGSPDGVESPARFWTLERLFSEGALQTCVPRARVGQELFARVHDPVYVASVYSGGGQLDADTVLGAGSIEAVEAAASCAWALGCHLSTTRGALGMALVRPPGHHAGRSFGGGYCFFNNVIIAAQALYDTGVRHLVILDVDAHFPNGTVDFARVDPRMLVLTLQQRLLFPKEGSTGELDDEGLPDRCVSVPLDAGAGDGDLLHVMEELVMPIIASRRPECVLVSLGIDAHSNDLTTDLRYSTRGYALVAAMLHHLTGSYGASLGFVLEGGYDSASLGECVRSIRDTLVGSHTAPVHVLGPVFESTRKRVRLLQQRHYDILPR